MTQANSINVRLDEQLIAFLDEIVTYMKTIAPAGMKPTRSDAVRLCINGWHGDHRRALEEMFAEVRST